MTNVPLSSAGLSDGQIKDAISVLTSGNLTMGVKVRQFEKAMAEYLNVGDFVMVNSGSSANLAIIEACMRPSNNRPWLRPGDGVIVPAIAWPTTVWPLIQMGLKPVFIDVDPETLGLDLVELERTLESSTAPIKAIFTISPLGKSLDESKLQNLSKRFGVTLLFDNCESLGSRFRGNRPGSTGLASSYSFYFSHHITTMEGGGVATDDKEMADDLRSIRSHGWNRDRSDSAIWESYAQPENLKFLFVTTGFNIRPMEIQAAIGLSQVSQIDTYVLRREWIAGAIAGAIEGSKLEVVGYTRSVEEKSDQSVHSWMLVPIRVKGPDAANRKVRILDFLSQAGIETRPILTGNFLNQPAIRRLFPEMPSPENFPVASEITETYFMVGCHHAFTDIQIEHLEASFRIAAAID